MSAALLLGLAAGAACAAVLLAVLCLHGRQPR